MEQDNTLWNISYFGFSIILIEIIFSLTYYSTQNYKPKYPDQDSTNRLIQIKNVFNSLFGENWYILSLTFAIIMMIMIILLYIISEQGVNVMIPDDKYVIFFRFFVIFGSIFSLGVISIAVNDVLQKNQVIAKGLTNYKELENYNKNIQIMQIIGLCLFILLSVIFAVWYFKRKHNVISDLFQTPEPENLIIDAPSPVTLVESTPSIKETKEIKKKRKKSSSR